MIQLTKEQRYKIEEYLKAVKSKRFGCNYSWV